MPKSVLFNRQEVLQKVTELFWRKGYHGTSMQDLVDTTGLNRSSLYNSFGDKFNLYQESLKYYQNSQNQSVASYFSMAASPKASIISLFEGIRDEIIENRTVNGCFFSNCTAEMASVDPQIHNFLIKNKNSVTKTFKKLIIEAQKQGEIEPEKNAQHLAVFLFSSLQGLRLTSIIENKESEIQAVTKQILSVL